jgi:hypothetical protein
MQRQHQADLKHGVSRMRQGRLLSAGKEGYSGIGNRGPAAGRFIGNP